MSEIDARLYNELQEKFKVYMAERGFSDSSYVGDFVGCALKFTCNMVMEYARMEKCAYCGAFRPRDTTSPTNGYCARCRENSHHDLEAKLREARAACKAALDSMSPIGQSGLDAADKLATLLKKLGGQE